MVSIVVRTPAASAGASSSVQLPKVCVLTAEESKTGGLLPRPSKSTLVDIDKDTVATLEDSSKATIMPHIRIPWLLKDGGRVGGDAILENVQGRVEALITNTQGPPIHLSQRLSPGIMRDASRSAFRPYRPSRPVAGRREGSTWRSQASSRNLLTTDPLPYTTLHLRSKHISMLSMPQLKFVRRDPAARARAATCPTHEKTSKNSSRTWRSAAPFGRWARTSLNCGVRAVLEDERRLPETLKSLLASACSVSAWACRGVARSGRAGLTSRTFSWMMAVSTFLSSGTPRLIWHSLPDLWSHRCAS